MSFKLPTSSDKQLTLNIYIHIFLEGEGEVGNHAQLMNDKVRKEIYIIWKKKKKERNKYGRIRKNSIKNYVRKIAKNV